MQKGKNIRDRMLNQGKVKILFEKGGGGQSCVTNIHIDQSRNEWTRSRTLGGGGWLSAL
jgi:hypothetical protein